MKNRRPGGVGDLVILVYQMKGIIPLDVSTLMCQFLETDFRREQVAQRAHRKAITLPCPFFYVAGNLTLWHTRYAHSESRVTRIGWGLYKTASLSSLVGGKWLYNKVLPVSATRASRSAFRVDDPTGEAGGASSAPFSVVYGDCSRR